MFHVTLVNYAVMVQLYIITISKGRGLAKHGARTSKDARWHCIAVSYYNISRSFRDGGPP